MKKLVNKSFKVLITILFVFSYFFNPFTMPVKAKQATTIKELKEQLAELQAQKAKQASAKAQTQSEIRAQKSNIYRAYQEKEEISNQVEDAKNKIAESEEMIEKSSKDIDNMLKYYQLSENGNNYMDYISDASSITEVIMRMKAVEQITTYYDNKIDTLKKLITEKQDLQVELGNKNNELNTKIDAYSDALSELNDQMEAIDEISEDIDTQIRSQQDTIKYYQSVCDSETQLLSSCTKDPQSFGWLKPTVKGRVSSLFGYRSFDSAFHGGVDIAGNAEGTPEYAAASGRVAQVTRRSNCGGNIVYLHVTVNGQRYTLIYAHMLEIKVKLNQIVTTDTVVGTVGGYSTSTHYSKSGYDRCAYGAHLHFGVAKGWYHVDYSSWSQLTAHLINPPGFPAKGVWWYKR